MRPGTARATHLRHCLMTRRHPEPVSCISAVWRGSLFYPARFYTLCTRQERIMYALDTTNAVPRYLGPAPWPRHRGVVPPCKPPRGPTQGIPRPSHPHTGLSAGLLCGPPRAKRYLNCMLNCVLRNLVREPLLRGVDRAAGRGSRQAIPRGKHQQNFAGAEWHIRQSACPGKLT